MTIGVYAFHGGLDDDGRHLCDHCAATLPGVRRCCDEYDVPFLEIDATRKLALAKQFKVKWTPLILIAEGQKVLKRMEGGMTRIEFEIELRKVLGR